MRTCSSSNLIVESSTTLKCHNHRRSKQRVEPFSLEETFVVTMADQRTMAELLQAPTEGYEDAIVFPAILTENFELKHGILNLFINQFFPPSKTTNLRNEITNFQQKFKETFNEAWDRFKDLLRACPYHGFTELHQLDTFYNALNPTHQDSLNVAAGGNLLTKTPRDSLTIIENKSKALNSRNKLVVSKVSANTSSSTTACPSEMAALTDAVNAMLRHVKTSPSETVKAISKSCVTCGGPHPYYECLAADGNTFNASAAVATYNTNQGYRPQGDPNYHASNQMGPPAFPPQVANLRGDLKAITTRSGISYDEPPIPPPLSPLPKVVEREPGVTKDTMQLSTENIQPPLCEKDDNLASKFVEIFRELHFELSFADALLHMLKFASISWCKHQLDASFHMEEDLTPKLTPNLMILELVDRSTTSSSGIAEDVFLKVGKFHFPADFVVVDYVVDPWVSLIRETLVEDDIFASGNPIPSLDPILSTSFLSLTPFEGEGDIRLLEKLLNDDPSSPLPPKELHFEEIKMIKSSIDDPPELELKDLPYHLEYPFLEGTDKLPVIISKELKDEEKAALLK
ncbi:reverse transcriptase domain-containing protein, partial [Tanacetum coccineum]